MEFSRRALIGGGVSLAGAGAVSSVTHPPTHHHDDDDLSPDDAAALETPLLLSVTDSSAGEFEILVGEQALSFTDRPLAARLARAARRAI